VKLYKTKVVTLKVESCQVCPNKKAERIKRARGNGLFTIYVCRALRRIYYNGPCNPDIDEARFFGGFLTDCPLEDAGTGSDCGGSATAGYKDNG